MKRDVERIRRIQQALDDANLAALICALPSNVLLLSGYWPVVGSSIGIFTRDGRVTLIVPEDECALSKNSWAGQIHGYRPGSLAEISNAVKAVGPPLAKALSELDLRKNATIGYEKGGAHQPSPYVSMHLFGAALQEFLANLLPKSRLRPACGILAGLASRLTKDELKRVEAACQIAGRAFRRGAKQLRAGLKETDVANLFRAPLSSLPDGIQRADGFVYCMSGPHAYEASASYQRSRSRKIKNGELVLIHCNSYADGFWTDITRTFFIGDPDDRTARLFNAVFSAREAALAAIKPGIKGSDVDEAARERMKQEGFSRNFLHPTGHGVGFAAIDHNAPPRLHPKSGDRLEVGMTFNIEPGIYIQGLGGLRHCDMVALTESGPKLLTPFQCNLAELLIEPRLDRFTTAVT
jgi:Xaa-Pro dipeptidase